MIWLEITFMVTGEIGVSQSVRLQDRQCLSVEVVSISMAVVTQVRLVASILAVGFWEIRQRIESLNP